MNLFGSEFLAGARFADDENGQLRPRGLLDLRVDRIHETALSNHQSIHRAPPSPVRFQPLHQQNGTTTADRAEPGQARFCAVDLGINLK
jgi:hypothetical protein